MKKNSFLSTSLGAVIIGSIIFSCSEATKIEAEKQEAPIISDFSPKSGKAKTEIKVWGDNFGTANKVMIGDVESGIKYRLTQDTIIIYPLSNSKTGKIKLINTYGETESTDVFTMEYPIPVLTSVPENGEAGKEIMIEGENLNVISEIKFGDVVAEITYQSDKEIIVKVPTDVPDGEKISFSYFNGENTISIESEKTFSPTKPDPVFDAEKPSEGNEGSVITFTGQNLHIIDKVIMNNVTELSISKSETSLSVTLPEVDGNTNITLTAVYYGDNQIEILSGFTIIDIKYYSYKNIMLGARESGLPSFFKATTGESFGACDIKDTEYDQFHFFTDYSSNTMCFCNPSSAGSKLKNFKCDGVAICADGTVGKNIVKFKVITDEGICSAIKSDDKEAISELFTDKIDNLKSEMTSGTSKDLKSLDKSTRKWNEGSVIMFAWYNDGTDVDKPTVENVKKIGFIYVTKFTPIDGVENEGRANTVTFNCYFQK